MIHTDITIGLCRHIANYNQGGLKKKFEPPCYNTVQSKFVKNSLRFKKERMLLSFNVNPFYGGRFR